MYTHQKLNVFLLRISLSSVHTPSQYEISSFLLITYEKKSWNNKFSHELIKILFYYFFNILIFWSILSSARQIYSSIIDEWKKSLPPETTTNVMPSLQGGVNDVLHILKLWYEFFTYLIIIEKNITLLTFYGRVVKFNNWYIFDFPRQNVCESASKVNNWNEKFYSEVWEEWMGDCGCLKKSKWKSLIFCCIYINI